MKRFLLAAAFAPVLVLAQDASPSPAASPAPLSAASPTPAPAGLPTPAGAPGGSARDAAATVPLPAEPAGPAPEKSIPLIPQAAPSPAGASEHHGRSRSGSTPHPSTFQAEEDIKARVLLREAKTKALEDPGVQADWTAAQSARGDARRRELLAAYYNHLYDRMIKINPSLTDHVNARRVAAIERLKQPRIGEDDSEISAENVFAPAPAAPSGPNPPLPEENTPATGQ